MGRVVCLDPSGSWGKDGMGSTGWALYEDGQLKDFGEVSAEDWGSVEEYWRAIWSCIIHRLNHKTDMVVCESFKLQPGKAMAQSWSDMATPQLIGYLRMMCYGLFKFILQDPSCKTRVADPILEHMGIIQTVNGRHTVMGRQTNLHMRDAIRHGVYWFKYGQKKVKN